MKEHDITNELKKAYPIKGKVEGWYFRTTETSAGVFLIEGRSVRGASISKQCAEPELDEVFAGCQREAQQIEGETVPLTDDDEAGLPRFHSLTAVGLAAYLGGPLAAGILIRRNFISMGEPGRGSWALWLSLLATVAIFGGLSLVPEQIMAKVPNAVIPAVYTAVIFALAEKWQGAVLRKHKENKARFYSRWRAAGVGLISLVLIMGCILAYAVATDPVAKFIKSSEKLAANESVALKIFAEKSDALGNVTFDAELYDYVKEVSLPTLLESGRLIEACLRRPGLEEPVIAYLRVMQELEAARVKLFNIILEGRSGGTQETDFQQALADQSHEIERIEQRLEPVTVQLEKYLDNNVVAIPLPNPGN